MQAVRWPQRCLMLLLLPAVIVGCGGSGGGSGEGHVLGQGKNLGEFEASRNLLQFDPAQARRFVITKVEVFAPGQLDGFPANCSANVCPDTPDEWPIVVISTKVDPACQRSPGAFLDCADALSVQCALGEEFPKPPTYISWARDSAGHPERHGCAYSGIAHPSELVLLGFVPHVSTAPTHFSLVVQGRDVPIRLTR
jgi:hypothetical protein